MLRPNSGCVATGSWPFSHGLESSDRRNLRQAASATAGVDHGGHQTQYMFLRMPSLACSMRNPLGKAPVKGDDGIVGYGEGSGGRLAPPLGHRQSKAREVLVIRSRISGGLYLEHKDEEDAVRDDNDNSERRGGSGCH
ncbi:hypothetical protein OPV22_023400 [Ensete ventricosum]|uniref:Uncharacterized protein n=1 Tax=Ensete ventricosum TaxID=4639 RepID=A0AAV8QQI8_ENSVE|nr:hypothetical protein OPV22_023400 [Ensete ventricosum]